MRNKYRSPDLETPPAGTPILSQAELDEKNRQEAEERRRLEEQNSTTNQSPSAPSIDPAYVKQLEDTVRQTNERMARLEEAILARPTETPRQEQVDPEKEKAEYYENPGLYTDSKIDKRLKETIAPINQFIAELRGREVVDKLIDEVKNLVQFKGQWDSNVESAVRQQLATVNPAQINRTLVSHAAINAIGLKAMGAIGSSTPTPTPNPTSVPNNAPPNVRPSNPPAPRPQGSSAEPELNENERRMARENGQTPKEFVFWRDLPPNKLMTAKWDKKTQTGTVG